MIHSGQCFSTAVQQINYPIHQGKANPAHGLFFFVGSIPAACYDHDAGRSLKYTSEADAIRAAIAAGATCIQGADCRAINPADYI